MYGSATARNKKIGSQHLLYAQPTDNLSWPSPNVDTLYSTVAYDVSRQDLELVVGEVGGGRYYSVAWYTPYGENYVTFGATTGAQAGTYLVSPARASNTSGTMQPDPSGRYEGVLHAPNTFGVAMIRILLQSNTADDLAAVNAIQSRFSCAVVDRTDSTPIGPPLTSDIFAVEYNASNDQLQYILDLAARFTQTDPPSLNTNTSIIPSKTKAALSAAGIDSASGTYTPPLGVNMTTAAQSSKAALTYAGTSNETNLDLGNDWKMFRPGYIGTFGTHYAARAYIAREAYLGMVPAEAIYPFYVDETFSLGHNESCRMQFSGRPPLEGVGFWGVAMYNADGYLVENEIDRYNIGDRSNLTYADGTLVYGSGDVNSTFEVLVQTAPPPDEYVSNWLPSPANGSDFIMLLRFYAPTEALQNGDYIYPKLNRTAAIV
ncbi:hypothetical protein LQW54_004709 [Pestalotiopsis sp. IQ-011]